MQVQIAGVELEVVNFDAFSAFITTMVTSQVM
jgi:hypothetical protein